MNEDKIDLSKAFLDSFQDKISSFRRGDNNGLISLHDSLSTIVMQITSEIMLKYSNMFNEKSISNDTKDYIIKSSKIIPYAVSIIVINELLSAIDVEENNYVDTKNKGIIENIRNVLQEVQNQNLIKFNNIEEVISKNLTSWGLPDLLNNAKAFLIGYIGNVATEEIQKTFKMILNPIAFINL